MKTSSAERENPSESLEINGVAVWLKTAREERGETIDDVARITRIGKNYLEAIEAGDLCKLPSLAYTRGFIRLYAAHLGLSSEQATVMMNAGRTATEDLPAGLQSNRKHPRKALPASRRSLILIAALTSALTAAYFLLKKPTIDNTPIQSSRTESSSSGSAVKSPDTAQPPSTSKSEPLPQAIPPQETREPQSIVLRLKAVSDGKISVTIDGSAPNEYDLVAGDLVEWMAENEIMLDLENAASVEGELDGAKLASFGEEGRAVHLLLKADGVHKK
jgi:cytoskeleton protein RodZ